jgi:hypothetical protein
MSCRLCEMKVVARGMSRQTQEVYSAAQDVVQMFTPLTRSSAITACPSARHPGSCGEPAAFRRQEPRQRDLRRKGYRRRSPTLDV